MTHPADPTQAPEPAPAPRLDGGNDDEAAGDSGNQPPAAIEHQPAVTAVLPALWAPPTGAPSPDGPIRPWRYSGIRCGFDSDTGEPLYAGYEHAALVLGPPRSGKSTGVVIPAILGAPGAVVATSTKPDLIAPTLPHRHGRGTCWYWDPSGTTPPPPGTVALRWSPLAGCESWDTAVSRAHTLTAAATPTNNALGDGGHWNERAEALLAPLFHAAACLDLDLAWVCRWVLRREITEPLRALGATPRTPIAAETLTGIAETDERERSGIYSTAARILSAYRHSAALGAATTPNFDPRPFVTSTDTLYLVAPAHLQQQLAPIVVCLLDDIRHHTYQRSLRHPPVLFALDEVANIAPLPNLPSIIAEGGSQGLLTVACLQDLNQARTRWGPAADGFLTLFAAKIALGGIADRNTLTALSYLSGQRDVTYNTRSQTREGFGWKDTYNQNIQQRPRIPPETINTIPYGHALLAHTNQQPFLVRLTPPPPAPPRNVPAPRRPFHQWLHDLFVGGRTVETRRQP